MKQTVLEMVQEIMSDMDSDEVNSITDTVESEQVASIIKRSYFNLMSTRNWKHLSKLIQLAPITDYTRPTHMAMPDNIKKLEFINYDCRKQGETKRTQKLIEYLDPYVFLERTNQKDSDDADVLIIDNGLGVELLIQKNKAPTYWTSFNDSDIVFDSYDELVDSVLQNSKVQAKAYLTPTWSLDDDFIPDLPSEAFPNLVEDAKSTAFLVLKQMKNAKAESNAQRQARWLSRNSWKAKGGIKFAKFGRRGRGGRDRDKTFEEG